MIENDSTYKYWSAVKRREHAKREGRRHRNMAFDDFPAGQILTKEKLAELLNRTPKTIQNWVTTQALPRVRIRHQYRFVHREVVKWAYDKAFISKEEYDKLKNYNIDI